MLIENVRYRLDWAKFRKGHSFFVPCIDTFEARAELEMIAKRLGMKIVTQVVVQDGIKGLRVWRV